MLLRLQKLHLNVGYKKGSDMVLTDRLSRVSFPRNAPQSMIVSDRNTKNSVALTWNWVSVNTAEFLRISNDGLKNVEALAYEADNQLQRLRMTVLQ